MRNRLFFKSQAVYEFIVYLAKRLKINTISDLLVFVNYYECADEYDLLFKLWHEVDDVYYPIIK